MEPVFFLSFPEFDSISGFSWNLSNWTHQKKNRNILMADGLDEYAESGFVYNVR